MHLDFFFFLLWPFGIYSTFTWRVTSGYHGLHTQYQACYKTFVEMFATFLSVNIFSRLPDVLLNVLKDIFIKIKFSPKSVLNNQNRQGAKKLSLRWHTSILVRKHLISLCNLKYWNNPLPQYCQMRLSFIYIPRSQPSPPPPTPPLHTHRLRLKCNTSIPFIQP